MPRTFPFPHTASFGSQNLCAVNTLLFWPPCHPGSPAEQFWNLLIFFSKNPLSAFGLEDCFARPKGCASLSSRGVLGEQDMFGQKQSIYWKCWMHVRACVYFYLQCAAKSGRRPLAGHLGSRMHSCIILILRACEIFKNFMPALFVASVCIY